MVSVAARKEEFMGTLGKTWRINNRTGCQNLHESKTRLYRIWIDMKSRCFNPNSCNYKHYGARGITVCDEWKDGFQNFKSWAISAGYNDKLTIDRVDNDGNYCPNNCRWENQSVQNMSKRTKNTSGYIGISKHSNGKHWYGRVKVDGKQYCTGFSEDIHEAAMLRNEYILSHGLKNRLNKIEVKL